jgi:large subunit ribosomal protein L13
MKQNPTHVIRHAVKGMLPKSRLGSRMASRLLVYPGMDHPHKAQKPKVVDWKQR